ncbi:MAG: adenosine kinase [Bacteroidales bacterium]|nr:adenosine kinase [Bacteroidales bacterium]
MKSVLGIGNALVDIITLLESDKLLSEFDLPKGSMQLVDDQFSASIDKNTAHLSKKLTSGGSAANTIHGLANLGVRTGFIGKIGKDKYGKVFDTDLTENKIEPKLLQSDTSTGRAMALVSPDSERTFATYLGAAVELSPSDLSASLYNGFNYLYIEGYLVQNHDLIIKALEIARLKKMKVALDLASYNVVEENREFLTGIIKEYVDLVFANEEEAKAITGMEPEQALFKLARHVDIAVVKLGSSGSIAYTKGNRIKIKPVKVTAIDTTGAGDLYAAGFLYGILNNLPIVKCGDLGSLLAGSVTENTGPKIDPGKWDLLLEKIKDILVG